MAPFFNDSSECRAAVLNDQGYAGLHLNPERFSPYFAFDVDDGYLFVAALPGP